MSVNWNMLMQIPNAGEGFTQGLNQGLDRRHQAGADAQTAERQKHEQALAAVKQHQDAITMGAKLVRQINPQDQAGWDQVLGLAQQYGIPLDGVPTQFDPSYVQNLTHLADAFDPQKQEPSSEVIVTPQPGAPALVYNKATGAVKTLVAPNDGSHPVGAPVNGQPLTDDQIRAMEGGQGQGPANFR